MADNPIRLLGSTGWTEARDLRQNARLLALRAKRGPIQPPEPAQALCPRIRCAEDYTKAAKAVGDPTEFAVAMAFLPADWENPQDACSISLVNLLRAEGVARRDHRRAAWVDAALRLWDGPQGNAQIASAVHRVARETVPERQPTEQAVARAVNEALGRLAEGILANLGDSMGDSHVDLLGTIESCRCLPEVHGLRAAENAIAAHLLARLKKFFEFTEPFAKVEAKPSLAEVTSINTAAYDFREAWRISRRRSTLSDRFAPEWELDFNARCLLLGWAFGANCGAWEEAGKIIHGIGPEAADAQKTTKMRRLLRLAHRAIPILAFAEVSRRADLAPAIPSLKADFPDFSTLIDKLDQAVALLCQGKRATLEDCTLPPAPAPLPAATEPHQSSVEKRSTEDAPPAAARAPAIEKSSSQEDHAHISSSPPQPAPTSSQDRPNIGDTFISSGVKYTVIGVDDNDIQLEPEETSQEVQPLRVPRSVVASMLAKGSGKLVRASADRNVTPLQQTPQPVSSPPKPTRVRKPGTSQPKNASSIDEPLRATRSESPSTTSDRVPPARTSSTQPIAVGGLVVAVVTLTLILFALSRPSPVPTPNEPDADHGSAVNLSQRQSGVALASPSAVPMSGPFSTPDAYSPTPLPITSADDPRLRTAPYASPEASTDIMLGGHKYRVPQSRFDELQADREVISAQTSMVTKLSVWLERERKNLADIQPGLPTMSSDEVIAWNQRVQVYNATVLQSREARKKLNELTEAYNAKIKHDGKRIR